MYCSYRRGGRGKMTVEATKRIGRMQARAVAIAAALMLGATPAIAAGPPKVIASSRVAGAPAATTVQATKASAHRFYGRAYGRQIQAGGAVTCVRGVKVSTSSWPLRRLVAGRSTGSPRPLVGGTCSVAVMASGVGTLRVQVLA